MQVEQIARICHEANRYYSEEAHLGHHLPWGHAPEWQRQSAIQGVQAIFDDPMSTPEDSHVRWYDHKVAGGWTYGPRKNADLKTHPCLLAYSTLPAAQRAKDALFVNIVRALMPADVLENYLRPPTPQFLTDADVRALKESHGLDPDKPFDPSAPIVVVRSPSEAITTTTEEVLAQLGQGSSASMAGQETSNGKEHQDPAADVATRQTAQADRDGHQGPRQEKVDAG